MLHAGHGSCVPSKELRASEANLCMMQAARIIANLLVAGGGVLFRAAAQAYRQAIVSACPQHHTLIPVASRYVTT